MPAALSKAIQAHKDHHLVPYMAEQARHGVCSLETQIELSEISL